MYSALGLSSESSNFKFFANLITTTTNTTNTARSPLFFLSLAEYKFLSVNTQVLVGLLGIHYLKFYFFYAVVVVRARSYVVVVVVYACCVLSALLLRCSKMECNQTLFLVCLL